MTLCPSKLKISCNFVSYLWEFMWYCHHFFLFFYNLESHISHYIHPSQVGIVGSLWHVTTHWTDCSCKPPIYHNVHLFALYHNGKCEIHGHTIFAIFVCHVWPGISNEVKQYWFMGAMEAIMFTSLTWNLVI